MLRFLSFVSSIGKEEEKADEHGNSVKVEITCITPVLQAFLDFFQISLALNMVSTLVLVEVKLSGKHSKNGEGLGLSIT